MAVPGPRMSRRRRERRQRRMRWRAQERLCRDGQVTCSVLLAVIGLLIGAYVQEAERFGWLAGVVAAMLAIPLAAPLRPEAARSPQPADPPRLVAALIGVAVAGSVGLGITLVSGEWATLALGLLGMIVLLLPVRPALRLTALLLLLMAGVRMVTLDSFPALFDSTLFRGSLADELVRDAGFIATVMGWFFALWTARHSPDWEPIRRLTTVGAHFLALWAITYSIAEAITITRGAASSGNEALLIAGAWGIYGFLVLLSGPFFPDLPWKPVGQAVLMVAMGYMLLGGVMANGRWADWSVRLISYAAVLGSPLLSAWLESRRGNLDEADRYLSLVAAALGFTLISFEVVRWTEPAFTYARGTVVSSERLQWQRDVISKISMGLWALYGLVVIGVGRLLRSRAVRVMGRVMLFATALFGLGWVVL